jgi:hypothetical protein
MSRFGAIKAYFAPPEVTVDELKQLTAADRNELVAAIKVETGWQIDEAPTVERNN